MPQIDDPSPKKPANVISKLRLGSGLPVPGEKKSRGTDFGRSPNLVHEIIADCHALGIVGEEKLLLAIYLIGTSRLLSRPLSAIVQGKSSTGKSHLVSQVARLFPPEQVLNATRMTPQVLYHMESLSHMFVVTGERSRVQDDASADATAALRQLQSEGRITKLITEQEGGKHVARKVEQEGPIAYIETTTLAPRTIFSEDLNRALLLKTDDTEEQTRAILKKAASQFEMLTDTADVETVVQKHHEFQSKLERLGVSIPFATRLVNMIPAKKVEARRVGRQILSTIEAVTLLHQFQRQKDTTGRLVAEAMDYEIASWVLRQPLGESLGVGTSATALYQKLVATFSKKIFSTTDIQKIDKAGERTVRGWLSKLAEHGCINQVQPSTGPKPATWRLSGKTPEEAVLPTAESIGLAGGTGIFLGSRLLSRENKGFPIAGLSAAKRAKG